MGDLFGGGGGDVKRIPPPAPPLNTMPISMNDPQIAMIGEAAKKRALAASGARGFAGTVRTRAQGTGAPPTASPSLIGG